MSRTVLVGLDGATYTVLNSLFKTGQMPFLKEFMARGAYGELASTVHPLTAPAWTSMITGRSPGNHGVFDFVHCRQTRDGIFFTLNMSYDIRCPTLWSILSGRGMRVAALNYPVSFPAEPVNGVCVPGFVNWRHLKKAVYPTAFYEELRALPGFDAKLLSMDMNQELQSIQHLQNDEYEPWIEYHIQREEQWSSLVRYVLAEKQPDFTGFIFDGVDKLQHLCWRFLDPALVPSNPSPWEARIRELCLKYFEQIDGFVREIVTAAGPEARIFIASDHGFGPTEIVFFANAWLAQQGYLFWNRQSDGPAPDATNIADDRIKKQVEEIDWNRTVAFALNPSSNGIYIRRTDGIDSPGIPPDKYEEFRARLAEELLSLVDPYTGEHFFNRVLTREQAFPGAFSARAPDLTLFMKDNGLLSVLRSDAIFCRRREPWGTHYPEGIFMAAGPGIVPLGRMSRLEIVDVAPILLRSLGLAPELGMEGQCPDALFDARVVPAQEPPEFVLGPAASHPLPSLAPQESSAPFPGSGVLEKSEQNEHAEVQAEVLKRLRAIGYLAQ